MCGYQSHCVSYSELLPTVLLDSNFSRLNMRYFSNIVCYARLLSIVPAILAVFVNKNYLKHV